MRFADEPPTAISASGPSAPGSRDSGPLGVGQAFGPRYHIIRILGVGGMGAVYQAWDSELGVAVAIKVIRPEVMADPTAAARIESRFKRELLLARQVTHKNVVRIHDLGEINGIKYITMPYVDGADLASILKHEGRLPVPRVLRIARALVAGLIEAHKVGVVHRDLKPANIMIGGDGEAMIMDFGIARSTGGSAVGPMPGPITTIRNLNRALSSPDATVFGSVIGTVEYMAPEQAKGIAVDQRADLYALGLILYDMLTGQPRAAKAGNALHELQARMEHAPPPVKSVVPEVPDDVDRLVSRCLEPDAAKRYQTTEELAADLARLDDAGIPIPEPRHFTPRMIAASVLLVTLLVTGTWWLTRTPPPLKQHDPVSVVIADFQNNTGDASLDRALEPALRLGLEDAGFISAFDRSQMATLGVANLTGPLDEDAARKVAVSEGLGIVVSGAVEKQGQGYKVSVKAIQSVPGDTVTTADTTVATKGQVMSAVTLLAARLRSALGDETPESAKIVRDGNADRDVARRHSRVRARDRGAGQRQEQGRPGSWREGGADRRRLRRRLRLDGGRGRSAWAASGGAELHPAGCRTARPRHRARALPHPRPVVPVDGRPREMRGRVQGAGAPLPLGYVGTQQPRALRQTAPRHADGDRRDAEGRRDSAKTRALSRQPGVERRLWRRFRHGRARSAGIAHPQPVVPDGVQRARIRAIGAGRERERRPTPTNGSGGSVRRLRPPASGILPCIRVG